MSLKALLQELSPPLRSFVFQRVANLEDHELLKLVRTFEPFPASTRKAKHADEEDWYILPQHLANIASPRSKPLAEGLRMATWQAIVFEETRSRGLSKPEFWTKDEIDECRPKFLAKLFRFEDAPIDSEEFFTDEFFDLHADTTLPKLHRNHEYVDLHQDDQFQEVELEDAEEVDLSCIDENLEPQEIPLSNEEIEEHLYGASEEEEE
jgi:hypothetical protein